MSHHPSAPEPARRPVTLHRLRTMHAQREKIVMLTCYDAAFATVLDRAGVDVLLVGDSLGMVLQGRTSTLGVTVEDMAYHVRCVAAARPAAWIVGDLPFGSYHASPEQAHQSSATLMAAGAQMVKLEGGGWTADTVRFLTDRGIPVCAHLGLTPQSVHALGGYRVQGRDEAGAATLVRHARALADAGAAMLVLELVPAALAADVSGMLPIPTIGIGAGARTGGQVLVLHDMLGLAPGSPPRFVRNFLAEGGSIEDAVRRYVDDVRQGRFPDERQHAW